MYFSSYTTQSANDIFKELKVGDEGLKASEVKKRQEQYGLNQISAQETKWWQILGRQFKSPFIFILIFAAALAIFMGEAIDGIMIFGFIIINAVLGFIQEYHSEKSLKMLKQFVVARARVKRDGKDMIVDSKDLVVGDIVMVETGDIIPADLRFVSANDLSVNESNLSGESVPIVKNNKELKKAVKEINGADNLGFSGTAVVSGKGIGVVIAIGKNTVMGEVAKLTVETKRESEFEKGIAKFSRFILRMILVILVFLFVANIVIKGGETDIGNLILFSIALAVSVIPEALPVVTTLSLSRGALRLARDKVVVKRLSAVEDLGSIEVLCTDKTGTITENKLKVADIMSDDKKNCLLYGVAASSFLAEKKREPNNSFDIALWRKLSKVEQKQALAFERVSEIPFDPTRRRNSVLVEAGSSCLMVVRGAVESVVELCGDVKKEKLTDILLWSGEQGKKGRRTIAIASRVCPVLKNYTEKEEKDLHFIGVISFVDPIKDSTKSAITHAEHLGVKIKIITGDSREVAGAVAYEVGIVKKPDEVLLGEELEKMNEKEQINAVEKYSVFARVSPRQKYKIIELLQKKFEVGFLGEGINDAPALKLANVALVVDGASDIAREAADIVLLNPSLSVIVAGIRGGREVFANTVKYLKTTLISNFGNFYAIATASLIITFLPMLPVQILLLNLLSDFPMIAIALDTVDKMELRRPRSYNVREVVLMAIVLGLVSTVFDFIFFALFYKHEPAVLQTNWFIGSVLTELALIYSVRTHFFFLRAKAPSKILVGLSVLAIGTTILLPFTSFGVKIFKFSTPTSAHLFTIFTVVACYFVLTESIKLLYYKMNNGSNHPAKQRS